MKISGEKNIAILPFFYIGVSNHTHHHEKGRVSPYGEIPTFSFRPIFEMFFY